MNARRKLKTRVKAKFNYATWFEAGPRQVRSWSPTSFEPDGVMEFGFKATRRAGDMKHWRTQSISLGAKKSVLWPSNFRRGSAGELITLPRHPSRLGRGGDAPPHIPHPLGAFSGSILPPSALATRRLRRIGLPPQYFSSRTAPDTTKIHINLITLITIHSAQTAQVQQNIHPFLRYENVKLSVRENWVASTGSRLPFVLAAANRVVA